jgi:hypothetical protein
MALAPFRNESFQRINVPIRTNTQRLCLVPTLHHQAEGCLSPRNPTRANRHRSLTDQHAHLSEMMRGHYAYYGVTGNGRRWYANQVGRIWKKWLSRRDRQSAFTWNRFNEFLKRHPLPPARIVHRYAAVSEALS